MVVRASTHGVPVVLQGAECGMVSAHGTAWVTAGQGKGSRGLRSKLSLGATKSGQEPNGMKFRCKFRVSKDLI
jgi:hypothetical protein